MFHIFILIFIMYNFPAVTASNNEIIINSWDHLFCAPGCDIPHHEELWFAQLCTSFSKNPQNTIDRVRYQATSNTTENKKFHDFLEKLTKKCDYIQHRSGFIYSDYWFSKNPSFVLIEPRFAHLHPSCNRVNATTQIKDNFKIETLFALFLYLCVTMPELLQNRYKEIHKDAEPIFYTNDPNVLFEYYQEETLACLSKTRAYIDINVQGWSPRLLTICVKNVNILRSCLAYTFSHDNQYFNIRAFNKIMTEDHYKTIKINLVDTRMASLERTSFPFRELSKTMHQICAFLRIFVPQTKDYICGFRRISASRSKNCNDVPEIEDHDDMPQAKNKSDPLYSQFVMTSEKNPYWDSVLLQQLDDKEAQLLFNSLDRAQERLHNEKYTENVKLFIKNVIHRCFNSQQFGKDEGSVVSLFFGTFFSLFNNINNILPSNLYYPCCKLVLNKIRNSTGNTCLHYALKNGANEHIIINLTEEFPEHVTIKNKDNETPLDIYKKRLENFRSMIDSDSIKLTEVSYDIYPDVQEFDERTIKKLQTNNT